jgi:hypothetical protein
VTKLAARALRNAPQLYPRLPRTIGAHLGPHSPCPSPAPTNHNRNTGSKNADFNFENPQQTKLGARAVPNAPQLYSRLLRTILEHLGPGSPGTWELNFRSDFLRPPMGRTNLMTKPRVQYILLCTLLFCTRLPSKQTCSKPNVASSSLTHYGVSVSHANTQGIQMYRRDNWQVRGIIATRWGSTFSGNIVYVWKQYLVLTHRSRGTRESCRKFSKLP